MRELCVEDLGRRLGSGRGGREAQVRCWKEDHWKKRPGVDLRLSQNRPNIQFVCCVNCPPKKDDDIKRVRARKFRPAGTREVVEGIDEHRGSRVKTNAVRYRTLSPV